MRRREISDTSNSNDGPLPVHRYDESFSLDRLVADQRTATAAWDWSKSRFGHSLSLPQRSQLHPAARYQLFNHPCSGLLEQCPYFREIFDGFECEKFSFRLLIRKAGSSYGWHCDPPKGSGVARFQIPIVSESATSLVLTDYTDLTQFQGDAAVKLTQANFDEFVKANEGHFRTHRLEVGQLHYFNTSNVHTLLNAGTEDRVTLVFDLVANDWVLTRYPEVREEVGDSSSVATPTRMQQFIALAKSQSFSARTVATRWAHQLRAARKGS